MSLNQITFPTMYSPEVSFNALNAEEVKTTTISNALGDDFIKLNSGFTECKLPINMTDVFGASYNNRMTFSVDGTATSLKLQAQNSGAGSYIAFQQPSGDFDLRLLCDPSSVLSFAAKSPIYITNESFIQSIKLNNVAGTGLQLLGFPAAGYTPSDFNCYCTTTITPAYTGFTTPQNASLVLTRTGNVVNFRLAGISQTVSGGVISIPPASLPVAYRPTSTTECIIPTTSSNTVLSSGVISFGTTGGFSILYQPGVAYFGAPLSGWSTFSGSYVV